MKQSQSNDSNVLSDEVLIVRSQQGDSESFGHLYERYLEKVYRYIYYRVTNQHDVEDLTENVFIRAWGAIGNYRVRGTPFLAWLYRIAHNIVVDYRRSHKVDWVDIETQYDLLDDSDNPEQILVAGMHIEQLMVAIKRLDPIQQDVLTLRFLMGLSHQETADILERQAGAIRVIQHRALHALRLQMKRDD